MKKNIKKIFFLLQPNEKKKLFILLIFNIILAFLDMIGVASIMPFMAVLSDPGIIETNSLIKNLYLALGTYGVETAQHFLIILGITVFMLLILSLSFKALTTYLQLRFALNCQLNLAKHLTKHYLSQTYSWFLNRNSSDLGKTILSESSSIINGGIVPLLNLTTQATLTLALIILLIIATPKIALTTVIILGVVYSLVYISVRKKIIYSGLQRFKTNQLRFKVLSEAFGAIKQIKVSGLEDIYMKRFNEPSNIFVQSMILVQLLALLPRYALEAVAFGGLLLASIYLIDESGTISKSLPILSLYALAGYRIMPALQQIYSAITQLIHSKPAIDSVYNDLSSYKEKIKKTSDNKIQTLKFNNKISIKNVSYSYNNSLDPALKNINLEIPFRATIGIVGATGSGKSTLVDIILGLLDIKNGKLEVDGQEINNSNRRTWQRSVGYVPQHIYLADDTVAANIAFGSNATNLNQKAVEEASKIANLHDFIMNELPQKYETKVGERGVRLSGGQRQRIGIARSLYNKPKLLVLDEATSSLDNMTERAVMEAVRELQKKITIILIAHRLTTVEECDKIFLLNKGELKGQGTYHELKKNNDIFQKMTDKEKKIATNK
tara:strand:+ start:15520 stop:17346 length:1827 start_codon:yes stop_codon:yes gene_type:complete